MVLKAAFPSIDGRPTSLIASLLEKSDKNSASRPPVCFASSAWDRVGQLQVLKQQILGSQRKKDMTPRTTPTQRMTNVQIPIVTSICKDPRSVRRRPLKIPYTALEVTAAPMPNRDNNY